MDNPLLPRPIREWLKTALLQWQNQGILNTYEEKTRREAWRSILDAITAYAADRRTSGTYVEDEGIEWKAASRIRERFGDGVHINVTSYNRSVLLTGEAPNETVRNELETLVSRVEHVASVMNEIVVGPNSTLTARGNDALITSNVKARFVDAGRFSAHHVKVVTEANVVFLLGLVTRAEADAAAEVARNSQGVRKVVRVFQYISDEEARRLSNPVGTRR